MNDGALCKDVFPYRVRFYRNSRTEPYKDFGPLTGFESKEQAVRFASEIVESGIYKVADVFNWSSGYHGGSNFCERISQEVVTKIKISKVDIYDG